MLRYLRAAFWARPTVPGLGRVPLNAVATLGIGILGLGHPAFWLLGLGLETGYLSLLATNARFQRWVDGMHRMTEQADGMARRSEVAANLAPASRERLSRLEATCARILDVHRDAEAFVAASDRDALERVTWIYLKLLVARERLEASQAQASAADLESRIAGLDRDLALPGATSQLRESQQATRRLLERRLANLARGDETRKEVDSDLARIEAQVDLALDNARLDRGDDRGDLISGDIAVAGLLMGGELDFGDAQPAVAAVDRAYAARAAQAVPQ